MPAARANAQAQREHRLHLHRPAELVVLQHRGLVLRRRRNPARRRPAGAARLPSARRARARSRGLRRSDARAPRADAASSSQRADRFAERHAQAGAEVEQQLVPHRLPDVGAVRRMHARGVEQRAQRGDARRCRGRRARRPPACCARRCGSRPRPAHRGRWRSTPPRRSRAQARSLRASAPPGSSRDRSGGRGRAPRLALDALRIPPRNSVLHEHERGVPIDSMQGTAASQRRRARSPWWSRKRRPARRGRRRGRSRAPALRWCAPPSRSATPWLRIASRLAPRATTETSCPAAANFAARCPPTAPAPKTQMRICHLRFYLWCNIAPLDSSMSSRWFKDLNPALLSLGGTGTAGYTPKSLIYI